MMIILWALIALATCSSDMSTGAFIDSRDTAAAPLPKLPSEDPFYTPTTGFQQKAPGKYPTQQTSRFI